MLGVRKSALGAGARARIPALVSTPNVVGDPDAGSLNIAAPAHEEGDRLVAFLVANSSGAWTLPAEWSSEASGISGSQIATKVAGPSEPGSYTFTYNSGGRRLGCAVAALSAGAEFEAGSIAASNVMTSISPAGDALLLLFCSSIASTHSFTTPDGMSLVGSEIDGNFPDSVLYTEQVPAGATGTRTNHADVERSLGAVFAFA